MVQGESRSLIVGVWQGFCDSNIEFNFERAAAAVREAARVGCSFLCLPECFLTGYGTPALVARNAIARDDRRLITLAREAALRKVTVLAGLAERRQESLFITQVVLDEGRIAGSYSKTVLTAADREIMGFSAVYDFPTFEAHGIRFGIQICHDSAFPEIASSLTSQGVRLLFSPHFNLLSADRIDVHRLRARSAHAGIAALFGIVVARSNIVATEDPLGRFGYGDSAIFSPIGTVLTEAGLFSERLAYADIQPWLQTDWQERRSGLTEDLIRTTSEIVIQCLSAPTPHFQDLSK